MTEWLQLLCSKKKETLRIEDTVDLSSLDERDREVVLQLLRSYPDMLNKREAARPPRRSESTIIYTLARRRQYSNDACVTPTEIMPL